VFNIKNLHIVFLIGQEPRLWNLFGAKKNSMINRINNGEDFDPSLTPCLTSDMPGRVVESASISTEFHQEEVNGGGMKKRKVFSRSLDTQRGSKKSVSLKKTIPHIFIFHPGTSPGY